MRIDLRSDTVTKPGSEMLRAMMEAEVGDDVFAEDPTVNKLQNYAAELFGMEASLFCPSGTMTNQIAIRVHCQPMQEVIVEKTSHTYKYEGGGIAANSGASVALIDGDRGMVTAEQVKAAINPDDAHYPQSRLVSLENTCNKGGGSIYDIEEIRKIKAVCDENGLSLHLDGARFFNALAETGESPAQYGELFDSISICLSKGLGAPVGSLLLGSDAFISKAHRVRKAFGGGMRQAGYLAAAGLFALKNQRDRLIEDHRRARRLAEALEDLSYVKTVLPAETNIVVFELENTVVPEDYLAFLSKNELFAVKFGENSIRFVSHLDISENMIDKAISIIRTYK